MGVIPPPPPPLYGSREERREQLREYRDHLESMQSQALSWEQTVFCIVVVIGLWIWGGVVMFG